VTLVYLLWREGVFALGAIRQTAPDVPPRALVSIYRRGWESDGWTVLRRLPAARWRCRLSGMPDGASLGRYP
jgi:hypothetical protein